MSAEETYDVVIIGGGHNGITAAAYLAKCGLSVCVLEERPEVGGGQENVEPMAGVRIDPHATYLYAAASPGFEQLELHKYGFRMSWNPRIGEMRDPEIRRRMGGVTSDGVVPLTDNDLSGWDRLLGLGSEQPYLKDFLRASYWCPPHPQEMQEGPDDVPWVQVLKEKAPEIWSESLLDMTYFDLLDEFVETESYKTMQATIAWYSGAAPHWQGMALPSFAGAASFMMGAVSVPRGGMHAYAHSIARCAIANGARIRTCCPVDEIIIRNGRAAGVRLRDDAAWGEKTIWADKAILSGVDVKKTFLDLVGPGHTDPSFRQRLKDISYKGGSIYCAHILLAERPRYGAKWEVMGDEPPVRIVYPCDSRSILLDQIADVDSRKVTPSLDPDKMLWLSTGSKLDEPTMVDLPGHFLESPLYFMVPAPEYHADGPEAVNKMKAEIDAAIIRSWGQVAPNVPDNIVAYWSNSPYDSEFRNAGMIGGNWYATRHSSDDWWNQRPLPELSRYRTPIDGLYLCNQTSHPGGLCMMAVPYNLMHILIDDGIAEPGDWWYPSPHYRREEKKEAKYV